MNASELERVEVYFSGRVQGVGFRYTARAVAAGAAVSGYVRNLPDGRVHLVVEGTHDAVASYVARLREQMSDYIRHTETISGSATGEFQGFEVRH
jgi:acylphosphatase